MKKINLILLGIIISISTIAQTKDFYRLYNYSENTPKSKTKSVLKLSNYLKKGAKSNKEFVELIYYWISINIEYDVQAFQNRINIEVSSDSTLNNRKSICSGYANLVKELCDAQGIECEIISGIAKGYNYNNENNNMPNHQWNTVKLNNKWELLDVTWGSGYVEKVDDTLLYYKRLCIRYLFDTPEDFILNHYPLQTEWQLLRTPISIDQFFSPEMEKKRQERENIQLE